MNLSMKFNDSFRTSGFLLQMYSASSYGSNSFCFEQMEKSRANVNEAPQAQQKILGL